MEPVAATIESTYGIRLLLDGRKLAERRSGLAAHRSVAVRTSMRSPRTRYAESNAQWLRAFAAELAALLLGELAPRLLDDEASERVVVRLRLNECVVARKPRKGATVNVDALAHATARTTRLKSEPPGSLACAERAEAVVH